MAELSQLFRYETDSVSKKAPKEPGVYVLVYRAADGKTYVFYVGQSLDLQERLLDHLGEWEPNGCIRLYVENYDCFFRFVIVRCDGRSRSF